MAEKTLYGQRGNIELIIKYDSCKEGFYSVIKNYKIDLNQTQRGLLNKLLDKGFFNIINHDELTESEINAMPIVRLVAISMGLSILDSKDPDKKGYYLC